MEPAGQRPTEVPGDTPPEAPEETPSEVPPVAPPEPPADVPPEREPATPTELPFAGPHGRSAIPSVPITAVNARLDTSPLPCRPNPKE